jgi:hypothetical protein
MPRGLARTKEKHISFGDITIDKEPAAAAAAAAAAQPRAPLTLRTISYEDARATHAVHGLGEGLAAQLSHPLFFYAAQAFILLPGVIATHRDTHIAIKLGAQAREAAERSRCPYVQLLLGALDVLARRYGLSSWRAWKLIQIRVALGQAATTMHVRINKL